MKQLAVALAVLLAGCSLSVPNQNTANDEHAGHSTGSSTATFADRLNSSPRHQEWVEVKNGDKTIYTWVVYPQTSEKRPVVLIIHENKGLNDWARSLADQVAEAGYIAVAPDLLSGFSPAQTRTSEFETPDAATKAIGQLKPEAVQSNLQAVADWAKAIPSSNGKVVSAGFCWGGAQSFAMAAHSDDLAAALVFYGTGPTDEAVYSRVSAPVFGFYGGADERVNATIARSQELMSKAGKTYEPVMYDGAGHAFMRLGEDPKGEAANRTARNAAWERMKEILRGI